MSDYDGMMRRNAKKWLQLSAVHDEALALHVAALAAVEKASDDLDMAASDLGSAVGSHKTRRVFVFDDQAVIVEWSSDKEGRTRTRVSVEDCL